MAQGSGRRVPCGSLFFVRHCLFWERSTAEQRVAVVFCSYFHGAFALFISRVNSPGWLLRDGEANIFDFQICTCGSADCFILMILRLHLC